MYECRNDIDIFSDLARRFGIDGYNDKTEFDWLRDLTSDAIDDFPTVHRARRRALSCPGRCGRVRAPNS